MLKDELKRLDSSNLEKVPTKYLLSLFKKCKREQHIQVDDYEGTIYDQESYDLACSWEHILKDELDGREHIETSKIKRKQIRQENARRG